MLRADGIEIPRKAEMEQAYVIHWMLGYYLNHGANWREEAGKYVTAHIAARQDKISAAISAVKE